ncbi:MAG: glycosyltransferase family 4 protein [Gammaproteobacteria bacterium]|nr:glycosyltransferase family 4 protein [Gammaproteobacteria bacterium]
MPDLGPWAAHPDSTLILTFHNFYLDPAFMVTASFAQQVFYRSILQFSIQRGLQRVKAVTAVSNFTADCIRTRYGPQLPLTVIRNGINVDVFAPKTRRAADVRILFAGNPIRRKGVEHLAALADELPENVRIFYTEGLRDSARPPLSTTSRLSAVARRSYAEMPSLYQDMDILFFPTQREGFGLVVAEAMACGLPIVATDCSSIPELVEHGRGGFLFDAGNRQQMREFLLRLVRDPGLRAEMGAYNRMRILQDFRLERMLSEYRELFSYYGA